MKKLNIFNNTTKEKKEKLLKNTLFAKKGGYSIALTAIVLVGIIVINILVTALNNRFVLEFDMSSNKKNSISQENIDYIKDVKEDIEVIVCASEETYSSYVGSMAQQNYGVTYDATVNEYFEQTIKLINKYNAYNDKINVRFVDSQSSEFNEITAEYGTNNIEYGSIIVSTVKEDGTKRFKKLGFSDVYTLEEDQSYAAYGMTVATMVGNNIETALTGAIAYVLSDIDTKVLMLTGHSAVDMTEDYQTLLKNNNYEIDVVSDGVIGEISEKYDLVVIPAPAMDFTQQEINYIAEYLENDGKLGKALTVFADASSPYLTNLYSYLAEWGMEIGEGVVYETNSTYHIPDDNTVLASANTGNVKGLEDTTLCITGSNVPITPLFETEGTKTANVVISTTPTVVEAPKGTVTEWAGAEAAKQQSFATVMETVQSEYDEDNNVIESTVTLFGSSYFLTSSYNESSSSNKEVTLIMADKASGAGDTGISFVIKNIESNSFYESVTESSANAMRILFMLLLPIATLALGIVIFIKRRNA